MLSTSSSNSFSASWRSPSISSRAAGLSLSCSIAFSSRSNSLIEYQRRFCGWQAPCRSLAIRARIFSSLSLNFSGFGAAALLWARLRAALATSVLPSPLTALVSMIWQPSASESFLTSILSPFLRTMSIMLRAMTIGTPISSSWVVRYRLRSRLEASMMLIIESGCSFTR